MFSRLTPATPFYQLVARLASLSTGSLHQPPLCATNFHELRHGRSSEDPLGLRVDLLEGRGSTFVEDVLGGEAPIFIVVVCVHAGSELLDIILTELVENGLAGGALIFSGEATCKVGLG